MTMLGAAPAEPPVGQKGHGVAVVDTTFEAFARRQRRPLVAFAWSLTGDLSVAEDLSQDALQAAWEAWDLDAMDTMTVSVADAPRSDEILLMVAYACGPRANARTQGPNQADVDQLLVVAGR